MGLELRYNADATTITTHASKYDFHYRMGCAACPLRGSKAPKVEPYGSKQPDVYILGEAPGRDEVKEGRPFVGLSGQMLRKHIPKRWNDERRLRWNNCLKTRPPDNSTPTPIEMTSCRKFLEDDICATKPKAIFGFGAVPLSWMGIAESGILTWAGRYVPVRIRDHACWYFPMIHPSYVSRVNDEAYKEARDEFRTETEFAFYTHLTRAFALVDDIDVLGDPEIHTRADAMDGITSIQRFDRDSANRIVRFIERMYDEDVVGFDYETNATRPYANSVLRPNHPEPKILSASLSNSESTLAWPIAHREAKWSPEDLDMIEDALERFLFESECKLAVHNAAFEMEWSAQFYGKGCIRSPRWECSMSQAYILDERTQGSGSGGGPQSLDWLTRQYYGFSIKALNPVNRADLDNVPLREVLPYNGCDSKYHLNVFFKQRARLKREGLQGVYREHMRRVRAAVFTGLKGLPIDFDVNADLAAKYTAQRDAVGKKIEATDAYKEFFSHKGRNLSLGSNPDIIYLVDKVLPAKATRKARGRDGSIPNANEGTLSKVKHEVADLILDWRSNNKTVSTYLKPMREDSALIFDDGRLHPQTRTTTVVTWRTSSDGPNYQNWTKRDPILREVRKQVRDRRKGYKVVSFDYAGIQARNVAMESKDPELVKAFRDRYDIHADWTEQLIRLHPRWIAEGVKAVANDKDLFKAYRNRMKNEFVFPSLFGAQDTTVAHYLKVDDDIGVALQGMFWRRFGGVFDWHAQLFEDYRELGYVTGLSGFRRRAPISANELINTPIQSDEAIIVCDAMARLCDTRDPDLQPNMEIHDDLSFIMHESKLDRCVPAILDVMLNCPFEWAQIVPLGVEYSIGDDWFAQKAMGEYFSDTWKGVL